ncbi:MAG: ATP-dependent helicase, partial [Halobacteriales archaeon]|nr:ATP-dependent helicase [Halobacteriales archaeon]
MAPVVLRYERGTVRIDGELTVSIPFVERDDRSQSGRVSAGRYHDLIAELDRREVAYTDEVLSLSALDLSSSYQLREYQ